TSRPRCCDCSTTPASPLRSDEKGAAWSRSAMTFASCAGRSTAYMSAPWLAATGGRVEARMDRRRRALRPALSLLHLPLSPVGGLESELPLRPDRRDRRSSFVVHRLLRCQHRRLRPLRRSCLQRQGTGTVVSGGAHLLRISGRRLSAVDRGVA